MVMLVSGMISTTLMEFGGTFPQPLQKRNNSCSCKGTHCRDILFLLLCCCPRFLNPTELPCSPWPLTSQCSCYFDSLVGQKPARTGITAHWSLASILTGITVHCSVTSLLTGHWYHCSMLFNCTYFQDLGSFEQLFSCVCFLTFGICSGTPIM